MKRSAAGLALAWLAGLLPLACASRPACDGVACAAACPRDARRDRSARCACVEGTVLAAGACAAPAVGDAYCGPGERIGVDGCSPRACAADEAVDVVTGTCAPRAALRGGTACPAGTVAVARAGKVACLAPAATCPRGTRRAGGACARPACPPGSLPEGDRCKVFVTAGAGPTGAPRVDLGTWAALVMGVDGGAGSEDLCRPLSRRADALQVGPGETRQVAIHIALGIPDEDVSRTTAAVEVSSALSGLVPDAAAPPSPPPSPEAREVVERAVSSLIEPFRALGGESSVAALELTVRCSVSVP